MLGSIKVTFFQLAVLVLTILGSALSLRARGGQGKIPSQDYIERQQKKQADLESQFPAVDYDAVEITDVEKREKRRIRSSRYDRRNFVKKNPTPGISEAARILEGYYVPAIPVAASVLVVTGEALSSEAHLSNDKSSVYTELTVLIDEVLKNSTPDGLSSGDKIIVTREGGMVRYGNGHRRLYHLAEEGMPTPGRRYVWFLGHLGETDDYKILTGYEMTPAGIFPVDLSHHFQAYKGRDNNAFLNAVRVAISESRQTAPPN